MKNVLIVDDDRILRRLIANKLAKQGVPFSILLAENGKEAVTFLKRHPVSLVVTDLQMPEMDGFALLAHLSAHYPDIPVVILTAYSTPDTKKKVLAGGAIGYMEKPLLVDDLAQKITRALERESEGGVLQTIPLETFVQLIEMEQKTCTIRVTEKASGVQGVLFFRGGELFEARVADRKGEQAAYEIFSWEKVTLAIQDDCPLKEKRIQGGLQAILFDAMRRRDESEANGAEDFVEETSESSDLQRLGEPSVIADPDPLIADPDPPLPDPGPSAAAGKRKDLPAETLPAPETARSDAERRRDELVAMARGRPGVQEVYPDARYDPLMQAATVLGRRLGTGRLRSCYLSNSAQQQIILLPDEITTVVTVAPDCPRDIIVKVLYG